MILFLKLIIAHILGDFVLQPTKWVNDKKERKHKSHYLYIHILIHVLILVILLKFDFKYWLAILIISITHFFIDLIKLNLNNKLNSILLFCLDQILHLGIIALLVSYYEPYQINIDSFYSIHTLTVILALLCVTYVCAIIMKLIMSTWTLDEDSDKDSLKNAGMYIGMLERLFVFGFITLGQWEAIGLLIAAKSVFRFGDLSRARDRKLTEYILIGTLLSFGLAFLIGIAYQYLKI